MFHKHKIDLFKYTERYIYIQLDIVLIKLDIVFSMKIKHLFSMLYNIHITVRIWNICNTNQKLIFGYYSRS